MPARKPPPVLTISRVPACFESRHQFLLWAQTAVESKEDPRNFCGDCTEQYQAEMTAGGRCEAPDIQVGELSDRV